MSQPPSTPSPHTTPALSTSQHMAPPATPGGNSPTPAPRAPKTPGTPCTQPFVPTVQGGTTLRGCTTDKAAYKVVTVHTAKCTECDRRNMDTMLRCPGCAFQICKPCKDRREEQGRELSHGVMASPGGLLGGIGGIGGRLGVGGGSILRSGGLGSGSAGVTRKKLSGVIGSPGPSPGPTRARGGDGEKGLKIEVEVSIAMMDGNGGVTDHSGFGKAKGKTLFMPAAKPFSKKRPAKAKPKAILLEESTDDEFTPDLSSPTTNKRRRATAPISDTPTATSARPSRNVSAPNAYVAPATSSSESSVEPEAAQDCPMPLKDTILMSTQEVSSPQPRPKDRIQELLEELGVNTPENPYQEHFLGRQFPVVSNPVIKMPPGLSGRREEHKGAHRELREENLTPQDNRPINSPQPLTVRSFSQREATKYQSPQLSKDENDELLSAILVVSRKWANSVYDRYLLPDEKQVVQRGFDMRLDLLNEPYTAEIAWRIEQCADAKLREFEQDRPASSACTPATATSQPLG